MMSTQSQERPVLLPRFGVLLWLTWVVANTVGGLVGEGLTGVVASLQFFVLSSNTSTGPTDLFGLLRSLVLGVLLMFGSLGVAVWLPLGLAQSLVLCRIIPGFNRRSIGRWTRTSIWGGLSATVAGGLMFAVLIIFSVESTRPAGDDWRIVLYLCLAGLSGGGVLGFSQWTLLRRYLIVPGWWIGANLVAWGVAVPLTSILLAERVPATLDTAFTASGLGTVSGLTIANALAGTLVILLAAMLTGLAWVWPHPLPAIITTRS
jgi:hypothetical protein